MANHKKKRPPNSRSHCHMCKPWKDGIFARNNSEFEKWSDHKRRVTAQKEI